MGEVAVEADVFIEEVLFVVEVFVADSSVVADGQGVVAYVVSDARNNDGVGICAVGAGLKRPAGYPFGAILKDDHHIAVVHQEDRALAFVGLNENFLIDRNTVDYVLRLREQRQERQKQKDQ